MREMREEVGKKTPKKDMDNPSFLWRHKADFWAVCAVVINLLMRK